MQLPYRRFLHNLYQCCQLSEGCTSHIQLNPCQLVPEVISDPTCHRRHCHVAHVENRFVKVRQGQAEVLKEGLLVELVENNAFTLLTLSISLTP